MTPVPGHIIVDKETYFRLQNNKSKRFSEQNPKRQDKDLVE